MTNMEQKSGISVHHSSAPTPTEQEEPTLSCAAIRGMKITTFMRLHYVPATAAEAAQTCRANHSDKTWNPHQNGRASLGLVATHS